MCDLTVIAAAVSVGTALSGAEDAEDAYHAQGQSALLNAQHRQAVANEQAHTFRRNAERIRNEQIRRLNETHAINVGRLGYDRDQGIYRITEDVAVNDARLRGEQDRQVGRITYATDTAAARIYEDVARYSTQAKQDYSIVAERLNADYERITGQIIEDGVRDINRIGEVTGEVVRRLGRRATETAVRGFEEENDYRQELAFRVSQQRSFYAAGNVVINTGTPASLQLDMMQQGEVRAQRIRRDYHIQVTELKDQASDRVRDALYQIEDIYTEANRAVNELGIERDRGLQDATIRRDRALGELHTDATRGIQDLQTEYTNRVEDINVTTAHQLEDLHVLAGRNLEDLNRDTDIQISDLSRNLGYDVSDYTFQADELDLQATITEDLGHADYAAGVNQHNASKQAGSDALTAGWYNAAVAGMNAYASGINRKTPVTESTPSVVLRP